MGRAGPRKVHCDSLEFDLPPKYVPVEMLEVPS
jgi:hypothetical protein